MQIIIKLPQYLILVLLLSEDYKLRTFILNSNNILLDLRDLKANLSSLVRLKKNLKIGRLEDVILHIVEEYFCFQKNGFWREPLRS